MIVPMITETAIATLIRSLAEAKGWAPSTAARIVSGSGDTLERIDGGIGLTLRRANRIIEKVAAVWPDDLPWPSDIPRPEKTERNAA